MSEFECNVKDLETSGTPDAKLDNDMNNDRNSVDVNVNVNDNDMGNIDEGQAKLYTLDQQKQRKEPSSVSVRHNKRSKDDILKSNIPKSGNKSLDNNVMEILLNDIKDKKNHRIFIVVVFCYIILNSQPIYNIINDMFPYLMETVNQVNIKGKIIIALLISLAVIISNSSLLNKI